MEVLVRVSLLYWCDYHRGTKDNQSQLFFLKSNDFYVTHNLNDNLIVYGKYAFEFTNGGFDVLICNGIVGSVKTVTGNLFTPFFITKSNT